MEYPIVNKVIFPILLPEGSVKQTVDLTEEQVSVIREDWQAGIYYAADFSGQVELTNKQKAAIFAAADKAVVSSVTIPAGTSSGVFDADAVRKSLFAGKDNA